VPTQHSKCVKITIVSWSTAKLSQGKLVRSQRRPALSRGACLYAATCLVLSCGGSDSKETSTSTGGTAAVGTGGGMQSHLGGSSSTGSGTSKTAAVGGSVPATSSSLGTTGGASAIRSSLIGGSSAGGSSSKEGVSTGGVSSGGTKAAAVGGAASGGMRTGSTTAAGGGPSNAGGKAGQSNAAAGKASGGRGAGGAASGGLTGIGGDPGSSGATSGGNTSGSSSSAGALGASTSGSDATFVPDKLWACGMADGIVPPSRGTLVFRATLQLGQTHDVGTTQYGHRRILDVKGGSLTGDRVQATFLTGGLELELTLSNGTVELEQLDVLRTSDNTLIYLRTCGLAPSGDQAVRVVPSFEVVTSSSLAWLNTGKFVGTRAVDATAGTINLDVYDVSNVSAGDPRIVIDVPSNVPHQSWDCATGSGSKGTTVFTESVTLGSSLSVGASKSGTRNIIPITGGTLSGRLTGSILNGGADYQLISGSNAKLDARYTLNPSDGEYVVVRNCGAMGALVPAFEARADGPYAFLNENKYLSSDPGTSGGGVSITFYERK
jgi:hypothetical protein